MAARKQRWHPDEVRQRIKTSQLINRLMQHVNGETTLDASQVTAALGLLNKVLPNLSATTLSGEVTHNYVARMPNMPASADEWQKQHSPTTIQ